ncbi:substrate-binding domain-containing protein [Halobacillus sp. HZG1]|uniref:LacI family DNA-binding transcriptional regulator n=1 Tax=Halobacillus sp. HZG1 TaxID=3111769 RepID=UPI002DB726BC|nr:substrate-binding domain-containing protein [Halobacillus sp. HZG1]MEC3885321.1 substrate-binding domain-containing protein [Halobacillus sp. HZG1]
MNATIKDVAKQANVSIATVSRILNQSSKGYSEQTRQQVMKAVDELGYRPNALARGLINKKTQTIGVLFPEISGMVTSELLHGIEEMAHHLGQSVIVCNTASQGEKTLKYLNLLDEKRVEGMVFASEVLTDEYYEALKKMHVPTVLVSTKSAKYSLPYVKVDDHDASYAATSYLIKKGHKEIGMISGMEEDPIAGSPRIRGFKAALEDHDLRSDAVIDARGFSFEHGKAAFPELIREHPLLTAVFAASDEMAVGALSSAYEWKIPVPEDLSIIGYDNSKIAEMSIPPLTTIAQPLREMGEKAVEMLSGMMKSGTNPQSIIMPHQIIERHTVRDLT